MNKEQIRRKFVFTSLKLNNLQRGVVWIPYYKYSDKLKRYIKQYRSQSPICITSNITTTTDLALKSLCIDKIVEEYLHSKQFHFENIGLIQKPYKWAPKTAILLIYSKQPTIIEYEVRGKDNDICVYKDTSAAKKYHRLSITGLNDGKNYVHLRMYDSNMYLLKERTIHIWVRKTDMSENPIVKVENLEPSAYPHILVTGGKSYPFVFDNNGKVLHFLKIKTSSYGILPLSKDRFLWPYRDCGVPTYANPHTCLVYEMDYMGRIHRTYHVKKGLHHFACVLPNGNIVSISNSIENHTEDVIVEIERQTGNIVREIYIKDLLGEHLMDQIDWAHPNTLEYNPEEDSMLVCLRNIHALLKFDWTTLKIHWMLSPPELWKGTPLADKLLIPSGDFHYSYQAHAIHELRELHEPNSHFRFYIVFDNHRLNRRPLPNHWETGHSYINLYGVNEKTMEVKQFKHLKIDLSMIRSNATYDYNANHIFNMSGCMPKDQDVGYRGKIEEYDYDSHHLINRWLIAQDFFSAYPYTWHSDDYCEPITTKEEFQYDCGECDIPVPFTEPLPAVQDTLAKAEWYSEPYITEDNLYFYTTDHSISALIFQGKNGTYQRDYSNTWQTYDIHRFRKYYCVISLKKLPPDNYSIMVLKDDTLYKTGNYVQITRN